MTGDPVGIQESNPRCTRCGKVVVPKGRRGSMTGWIFRPNYCACEKMPDAPTMHLMKALTKVPELRELCGLPLEVCKDCQMTHFGSNHVCEDQTGKRPSQDEQSLVGTEINQKFLVLGFVGRGGMSVVYRAKHLHLEQDVALKMLRSHLIFDDDMFMRFNIEAQAVSALTHKNIIRMFDFGVTEDARPYLAVEFLTGTSLDQIVKDCGFVEPPIAINWFMQIASALIEAHSQNIIHRDLKPSNIVVGTERDGTESVKILDFGIAKILSDDKEQAKLTQTGEVFGSPMYMSPEQCLGKAMDGRADIYSLGTLMYEVLSGKAPTLGINVLDTLRKQLCEPARPLQDVAPHVWDDLAYVVMRCLEKDPSARYQKAKDLLTDLTLVRNHKRVRRGRLQGSGRKKALYIDSTRILTLVFAVLAVGVFLAAAIAGFQLMPKLAAPIKANNEQAGIKPETITNGGYEKMHGLARAYIAKGNAKEAIPLLQFCIEVSKGNPAKEVELADNYRELGKCYLKLGSEVDARRNLLQATRIYEKNKAFPQDKQAFLTECAGVLKSGEFFMP